MLTKTSKVRGSEARQAKPAQARAAAAVRKPASRKAAEAAELAEIRGMIEKLHRDIDELEASVAALGEPRR